jgi:hypothetical protein
MLSELMKLFSWWDQTNKSQMSLNSILCIRNVFDYCFHSFKGISYGRVQSDTIRWHIHCTWFLDLHAQRKVNNVSEKLFSGRSTNVSGDNSRRKSLKLTGYYFLLLFPFCFLWDLQKSLLCQRRQLKILSENKNNKNLKWKNWKWKF